MEEDRIVARLPIHFTNSLEPNIHIHQFPLLTRPLQTPPSAATAGKRIHARFKPEAHRFEILVPVDTRPEVWNRERGVALGQAQVEDDKEKNQETPKPKRREGEEPRLSEVRLQSERVAHKGAYMLGIVRGGRLNLHPINETYQFRPTLTYLDAMSKKNKRSHGGGDDSDSDDGPPPDPDEPIPAAVTQKKEKKTSGEAKEVQVAARKSADDKGAGSMQGGLSASRRDMLMIIRAEEDEAWQNLEFFEGETEEASEAFEAVFSSSTDELECKSDFRAFLKDIAGL